MQQIMVKSSADLERVMSELRGLNRDLDGMINRMISEQRRVDAMWDGEANTAFNNNFNQDIRQFHNFRHVVDQYVTALEEIKRNYEVAEQQNTRIARDRSY